MKDYQYHIGLKVRFYPDDRAKKIVAINDGIRRSVYNHYVAYNLELYHIKQVDYFIPVLERRAHFLNQVLSRPAELKNMFPYMYGKYVDSSVVDNSIACYRAAWNNFRKNPCFGAPTFCKKSAFLHYQTSNHYTSKSVSMNDGSIRLTDAGHLHLPLIEDVRIRGSRKMIRRVLAHQEDARIGTATISRDATGRYYVSVSVASDVPFFEELPKTDRMMGLDVNLTNLYTDSDGYVCPNKKVRRNAKDKLSKAQRKLSRMAVRAKKEGRSLLESKNYQKQRAKVAELYRHLSASNSDYLDVASKRIVENQDYIFTENIKVKNLLKNHKLAYAISDVSWSEFLSKLERKAEAYGKTFQKVPAKNTTQKCSSCGYICKDENKIVLGVEEWTCPVCGAHHNRDHNSAINILVSGIQILGL